MSKDGKSGLPWFWERSGTQQSSQWGLPLGRSVWAQIGGLPHSTSEPHTAGRCHPPAVSWSLDAASTSEIPGTGSGMGPSNLILLQACTNHRMFLQPSRDVMCMVRKFLPLSYGNPLFLLLHAQCFAARCMFIFQDDRGILQVFKKLSK